MKGSRAKIINPAAMQFHPIQQVNQNDNCKLTQSDMSPVVGAPVLTLLRLEGLAAAALSAVFYARTGASWWMFAALWIVPDLSLLGYLVGPNIGARVYNAIHSYVTPATLAVCGMLLKSPCWCHRAHLDESHRCGPPAGYGLKYTAGFGWTHLGKMGRGGKESIPTS